MPTIRTRERESWHSTNAIEYSVRHFETMFVIQNDGLPRSHGVFVDVSIDDVFDLLTPCLASKGGGEDEERYYYRYREQPMSKLREESYYQFQEQRFTAALQSHHPDISAVCASKVTETYMEILRFINAAHNCPECIPDLEFGTCHLIDFKIQPRSGHHHHAELDEICEREEEEEAVRLKGLPAARASVMELFKASRRIDDDKADRGDECTICMEEMETWAPKNRLKMPCSHSFHEACLLHWLNNSNFCPLCRYQLPSAQLKRV